MSKSVEKLEFILEKIEDIIRRFIPELKSIIMDVLKDG